MISSHLCHLISSCKYRLISCNCFMIALSLISYCIVTTNEGWSINWKKHVAGFEIEVNRKSCFGQNWRGLLCVFIEICNLSCNIYLALAKFILSDVKNRSQLAFQWLYEEFNICLENSRGLNDRAAQENYDACLMSLLQGLLDKSDTKEG